MSILLGLFGVLSIPALIAFTMYADSRISPRRERCCCCPISCARYR